MNAVTFILFNMQMLFGDEWRLLIEWQRLDSGIWTGEGQWLLIEISFYGGVLGVFNDL